MRTGIMTLVAGLALVAAGCSKDNGNPRLVNPPDSRLKPAIPAGAGAPPAKPGPDKSGGDKP
jgi:hypothetical protein